MPFAADAYSPEVAEILELDGGGERPMPLAFGHCSSPRALELLRPATAKQLFPASRAPEAALAGLYLYFSCLEEAHSIAQNLHTPEGSFWHGILHRREPDPGNAAYWFRRVGEHPIFPELRRAALQIGLRVGDRWDPFRFIEYCEQARRMPGSEEEKIALQVQLAEWQLLFDYCAARVPAKVKA
jgi:hypothetical protein